MGNPSHVELILMRLSDAISMAEYKIKEGILTNPETITLSRLVNEGQAASCPPYEPRNAENLTYILHHQFNLVDDRIRIEAKKKKKRDEYAKLLTNTPKKLQKFIPLSPDAFYELLNDETLSESGTEILFNTLLAHIKKYEGKSAKAGEKGGAATLEKKLPFMKAYRGKRDQDRDASRASLVEKLQGTYPLVTTTLIRWAKEADKEDNFARKGGRPRINR